MKNILFITLIGISNFAFSQVKTDTWKTGDIFFQEFYCGSLCESIAAVTASKPGYLFVHAGLILEKDDQKYVVEAMGDKVKLTPLAECLDRSLGFTTKQYKVAVARFKSPAKARKSAEAAQLALAYLDTPYDDLYLPDGNALYCTELIQLVYRKVGLGNEIKSAPMTFKNPKTGEFYESWVRQYELLNAPIPEGLLGTNPGRLSQNKNLDFIFEM